MICTRCSVELHDDAHFDDDTFEPVCDDPMLGEDGTCWRCTWPLSHHKRPGP